MKYKIELKPGERKSTCNCGYSQSLPLCDNTHRLINDQCLTSYKSLKITNLSLETVTLEIESSNWKE